MTDGGAVGDERAAEHNTATPTRTRGTLHCKHTSKGSLPNTKSNKVGPTNFPSDSLFTPCRAETETLFLLQWVFAVVVLFQVTRYI